ncbi:MAG: aspartate/glutamate racemase family protein [Clostridia bacterium]|nr:aspartate/glutamate racemase family protein [Clostridia bacterium]
MDDRCIAIYDSGAGGLFLLGKLVKALPRENYLYFSDRKNLPYGDKTKEELKEIADKNLKTIMTYCPKLIVFACNTLSSTLIGEYSHFCVPIAGVLPKTRKNEKTLLICTAATARSEYIKKLKTANPETDVFPADGLAEEVENYLSGGRVPDLDSRFEEVKKDYDAVSLGCTHYNFIGNNISRLFPKSRIIRGDDDVFNKIQGEKTTSETSRQKGEIIFKDNIDKKYFQSIYGAF